MGCFFGLWVKLVILASLDTVIGIIFIKFNKKKMEPSFGRR